jgi:hypothetical protein
MTQFLIKLFDVEHGACAMLSPLGATGGGLAMIDCGHNVSTGWRPSTYILGHPPRSVYLMSNFWLS